MLAWAPDMPYCRLRQQHKLGRGSDCQSMTKAATTVRRFERTPLWRLLAAFVLLAFSFQSYVAQTHIHDRATTISAVAVHHGHGKSPVENSPLDCPFCQVVTHAGSFLMSDAPLLFLASQWVESAAPYHLFADTGTGANHHWHSRAPPSR
jgi:hypothetical protein